MFTQKLSLRVSVRWLSFVQSNFKGFAAAFALAHSVCVHAASRFFFISFSLQRSFVAYSPVFPTSVEKNFNYFACKTYSFSLFISQFSAVCSLCIRFVSGAGGAMSVSDENVLFMFVPLQR